MPENLARSIQQGILIAGPARCGKSQLVSAFTSMENIPLSVLTVDALLPYYLNSSEKYSEGKVAQAFIDEYLHRPRYMDSSNSTVRKPIDDIGSDTENIFNNIGLSESESSVSLIGKVLIAWATISKTNTWVAPELHAEFFYKKLLRDIPSLKIVVLLRDPREAVAAALYWRTFPKRIKNSRLVCIHKLLLWCLTASVGHRYSKESPNQVTVVYADEIESVRNFIFSDNDARDFNITLNYEQLHYSFMSDKGFLEPTGERSFMLTDNELYLIEKVAQPWFQGFEKKVYNVNVVTKIITFFARLILLLSILISYINPVSSKKFIDFLFSPYEQIKKSQNSIKNKLKNKLPQLFALYSKIRAVIYKK